MSIVAEQISHYRVKIGPVWLHAVTCMRADRALEHLRASDPVWLRSEVELVQCRDLDSWFGPFPVPGHVKHWLVEEE